MFCLGNRIYCFLLTFLLLVSCKKDNNSLVVGKIQNANELTTTEFTVDKIVHGTKEKRLAWFIKLNKTRFLAYSKVVIKTGVDLNQLRSNDIEIENNKISLRLPSVKVINFSYPPESFEMDDLISDSKKLFNKISIEDQEEYFRLAELEVRNNLKYMGIVETTQQHTRQMLTHLLKSLGYEQIFISFKNNDLLIGKVNLVETLEN